MKLVDLINNKNLTNRDINISGLSEDSRNIKKNYIFFFKSTKNSKEKYIFEAIKKGAKLVIYERKKSLDIKKFKNKCLFYGVDNISQIMSNISKKFYNTNISSVKIYGVTGTNGKSSVVNLISQLLKLNDIKCGVIGTLGCGVFPRVVSQNLTTPNIINICKNINNFNKKSIKNLAIEVSSHGLTQERIRGLCFDTVIFTNLTKDHLDYHKNMQSYYKAKLKLFKEYKSKRKIICIDTYYGKKIYNLVKSNKSTLSVSLRNNKADYYASEIKFSEGGTKFMINSKYGSKEINTSLYGEYFITNILLSIAALAKSKKEFILYTSKIGDLTPIDGRLNIYYKKNYPVVFIDYAHTPDALKKSLISIKKHFPEKNITSIFGCGGERDIKKRKIMGKIADKFSNKVIVTNDNPRSEDPEKIAKQIISGIDKKSNYQIILDRHKAIKKFISKSYSNEVILISGKGHEKTQILKNKIFNFSDRKEVLEALSKNE